MNVFALAPLFLLGIALGWLTVRSGSVVPAVILHGGCSLLLLGGPMGVPAWLTEVGLSEGVLLILLSLATMVGTVLAGFLVFRRQK
jgi:hypothetical protein